MVRHQVIKLFKRCDIIMSIRRYSMKRSTAYPDRRSYGEFKLNCQRKYNQIEKDKHKKKINPIFLQDNYGIKEAVKDE